MNIKELTYCIQSANINFLIGSGASRPFLSTLGSIEIWLTYLYEKMRSSSDSKYTIVEASIYKAFYRNVIAPNSFDKVDDNPNYSLTKKNYQTFFAIWNDLLSKRHSRILNKQVNVFTTNVDLMIEDSTCGMGIELNDGFRGSVKSVYDEANFMKSIMQTSLHFQHTSEIPVFNLLKVHGSINWKEDNGQIINNSDWYQRIENALGKIDENCFIDIIEKIPDGEEQEKSIDKMLSEAEKLNIVDPAIYNDFIHEYQKLIIINPTKRKFAETVLDYHFYELMRIYSNALEKENSVLFVAGFSFADEHIATLTRRSAENNPTLKVIIFAYCDEEVKSFKQNLGIGTTCKNNNITIISPSILINANKDDEYKELIDKIKFFDRCTVNEVFSYLNKKIYASYE